MDFLQTTVFAGNTALEWLTGLGVGIATLIVLRIGVRAIRERIAGIAKKTKTEVDDLIAHVLAATKGMTLIVASIYAAGLSLTIPDVISDGLAAAITLVLLLQTGLWANAAVGFLIERYRTSREAEGDGAAATTMGALGFVLRLLVWSTVLLLTLENLGVDITALVAGLGVGGIAVALAVQNLLGDLFASLSIVLDKPFVIGDFIIVGELMGTVEHVGLKTSRIRALSGEQLIFSNADLLDSRIRNFGRMYQRRVVFSLGVIYATPRDKLRKIPGLIKEAIEAQEHTRFDRSHFKAYGAFSLDFETVYYVTVADYAVYMDVQQDVNFHIHESFEREGIEFAFPTQTIIMEPADAAAAG